jgi:predicted ester cyclase
MSAVTNKLIARRYLEEIYNQKRLAAIEELLPREAVDGGKRFATMIYKAFPDLHITIEEMIAEHEKVVVRYNVRGTHKGAWNSSRTGPIPATGKEVSFGGVDIYRIVNGQIWEEWSGEDYLGMLQQLGVYSPAP